MLKSLLFTGFAMLFVLFIANSSTIDYTLSQLPYNHTSLKFYGETHLWCKIIYKSIPIIVYAIILSLLLLFVFKKSLHYNIARTNRFVLVMFLSLIVGPGLISNTLLKEHWGRPRPYQVFRDHQEFRPFYKPEFGKSQYNSFPSGHATIGFFLGVPFLLVNRRQRGVAVAMICGGIVGTVRILQGGHYLSDVVFSGIIVWASSELIVYLYDKICKGYGIE